MAVDRPTAPLVNARKVPAMVEGHIAQTEDVDIRTARFCVAVVLATEPVARQVAGRTLDLSHYVIGEHQMLIKRD